MVGSAIVRNLISRGLNSEQLILRTRSELDLGDARAVDRLFAAERPDHVYLAAAKVGGIHANNSYPAEFISENLAIQSHVITAAHRHRVGRLLFLGSSCIYPRNAPQPIPEEALLTGPLEPTNRPYALAKIAGIEMCWAHNREFGAQFLSVMPTNLFGLGDNYHPENSHVIPAMLRRFHEAKNKSLPSVTIWGSGLPRREFMFADDMADACVHLLSLPDDLLRPLLAGERNDGIPPIVNIGVGEDLSISDLARKVADTVGFQGRIDHDPDKPDGVMRKLLDSTRLHSLGWRSTTGLDEGLRKTYEDFQARKLS